MEQIDSDTFLVFKGTVEDIVSLEAFDKYVSIQSGKKFIVCCSLTDITKKVCLTKGFLINKY